jgi:class 3 adenylate cyclase
MTFDDILEQVITLLKRQGRVSYPALKRRFALDDDYIEDLKTEILYVHPVVDDEGKGLIWTGEAETKPASTSTLPAQPEVTQQDQPTPVEPLPTEHRSREAERKQLTVMFCDLVDSTKLSSQLDPEDYREVVREYQKICSEVIQRYDGHIAQYLGDGLLVYFGYPVAHEDDAQRAVRSGLGIIEAIGALNTRLEQSKGVRLAIRLGVHTGLVVIGEMGEMGGEGRREQLALGEVPNIASRLEGLAAPNTVVLSATTYRLIQGYFECESMGEQILRGLADPIAVYRVLSESGAPCLSDPPSQGSRPRASLRL